MYKILALQALNQALNMNLAKTIKISLWSLSSILELCLRDFYKSSVLFFSFWSLGVKQLHLTGQQWEGGSLPGHWTVGNLLGPTMLVKVCIKLQSKHSNMSGDTGPCHRDFLEEMDRSNTAMYVQH